MTALVSSSVFIKNSHPELGPPVVHVGKFSKTFQIATTPFRVTKRPKREHFSLLEKFKGKRKNGAKPTGDDFKNSYLDSAIE